MVVVTNQPSPIFLTIILVGVVIVGTSFTNTEPVAIGILIVILLGLLLIGYSGIHSLLQAIIGPIQGLPYTGRVVSGTF